MATGPRYAVPFRRRREGRTDYRSRLRLVRSRKPRAVVRRTSRQTIVQLIEFAEQGDRVLATATSLELAKLGWTRPPSSTPAAYLTGLLAAVRAQGKVGEAVLDIGLADPVRGSGVFAALAGLLDGGMKVPHAGHILPADDRIAGKYLGPEVPALVERVKGEITKGKPLPPTQRQPAKPPSGGKGGPPKGQQAGGKGGKGAASPVEQLLQKKKPAGGDAQSTKGTPGKEKGKPA